jgi:hypothetical protein
LNNPDICWAFLHVRDGRYPEMGMQASREWPQNFAPFIFPYNELDAIGTGHRLACTAKREKIAD